MDIRSKSSFLIAAMIAGALLVTGCGQRGSSDSVGQKMGQSSEKLADKASTASSKVAQAVDDSTITTKVKAALVAEPGLKSAQISVEAKDATVTLSGNVDSPDQKERAKQVASSVDGVKNVVDGLSVKSS